MKKIAVIGSGFAGLAAASILAQKGLSVALVEKNQTLGGRARSFQAEGLTFDMGPSWYWMPEVFQEFFALFGKRVSDYYRLEQLDTHSDSGISRSFPRGHAGQYPGALQHDEPRRVGPGNLVPDGRYAQNCRGHDHPGPVPLGRIFYWHVHQQHRGRWRRGPGPEGG